MDKKRRCRIAPRKSNPVKLKKFLVGLLYTGANVIVDDATRDANRILRARHPSILIIHTIAGWFGQTFNLLHDRIVYI